MEKILTKKAFTLAEVLITITVIGIVAAMTLPSLMQKNEDRKNMTALKKAYSYLQQATNLAIAEHESPAYWGMADNDINSITNTYLMYKPYFKIMRDCPNQPGCWAYPTKYLNNNSYWQAHQTNWYQYAFTLMDGVNVLMDIYPVAQLVSNFGVNAKHDAVVFFVDVNAEKNPNVIGRDIFCFVVLDTGLVPAGLENTDNCKRGGYGFTCVARIIHDGWTIKYIDKKNNVI